ncbi:MAG: serine/threonine protein kinase [Myxococcales bacterium]|nr:serine/threonine protein kinase [Myxococcales bacterium]
MPIESPPLDPIERVPATLGDRYDVVRPIGKGGAAVVYLVHDRRLQRWRAAKVLDVSSPEAAESRARFVLEARTMAQVDDPAVVRVYDLEEGEQPYLVMEYLPGGSVLEWLRSQGAMPPFLAVQAMVEICRGLQAAHALGIVHRDVKPHNVLISATGACKLTDFGIAKIGVAAVAADEGMAMGTEAFMAPEQRANPAAVDHRADLYGVGATLVALVARRAVPGLEELPPHHPALRPVPPQLRPIVLRACHADPSQRFGDAASLGQALQAAIWSLPAVSVGAPTLTALAEALPTAPAGEPATASAPTPAPAPVPTPAPLSVPSGNARSVPTPHPLDDERETERILRTPDGAPPTPVPSRQPTVVPPPALPTLGKQELRVWSVLGLAAVGIVVVMLVVTLVSSTWVSAGRIAQAEAGRDEALTAYVQALQEEQDLMRHLIDAGAPPQGLTQAWSAVLEAAPADRAQAAEDYFDTLRAGQLLIDADLDLRVVAERRQTYLQARRAWDEAVATPGGTMARQLGLAP